MQNGRDYVHIDKENGLIEFAGCSFTVNTWDGIQYEEDSYHRFDLWWGQVEKLVEFCKPYYREWKGFEKIKGYLTPNYETEPYYETITGGLLDHYEVGPDGIWKTDSPCNDKRLILNWEDLKALNELADCYKFGLQDIVTVEKFESESETNE